MDPSQRLVKTEHLKFDRLREATQSGPQPVDYDPADDTLYLCIVSSSTETVVHYIDDYIGLLYEPESLEVVGLQIEAFQHSFVPAHGLAATWELSDSEQRRIKNTADAIETSDRKKKAVAAELDRIAVRPLLYGRKGNQQLAFA